MELSKITNEVAVTDYPGIERVVTNWINDQLEEYDYNIGTLAADLQTIGLHGGMVGELIYYNQTNQFFKDYEEEIEELFFNLFYEHLTVYSLEQQLGGSEAIDSIDERMIDLYEQARDDIKADYSDEWDDMDELERDELTSDYVDGMELELNARDKNLLAWLAFEHVAFEIFQALGVE